MANEYEWVNPLDVQRPAYGVRDLVAGCSIYALGIGVLLL